MKGVIGTNASHYTLVIFFFMNAVGVAHAQLQVIPLPTGNGGCRSFAQKESIYYDTAAGCSGEKFIYNVSQPTLTVFEPITANGTAVIVCPGGAFHILGIDNEGYNVARWLNGIGITAFVLKYRLAECKTANPLKELGSKLGNIRQLDRENAPIVPLAIADGIAAMSYVRTHASYYKINPDRIGIMGFSAGGTVAAGVAFAYTEASRPDFVAPIYAYIEALAKTGVKPDAPPVFIAAATDDGLGFASQSILLYDSWLAASKEAELHIFSKGGHGFGMKKQGLPVDSWGELFKSWLTQHGYLDK